MKRSIVWLALLVALVMLAACGGSGSSSSAPRESLTPVRLSGSGDDVVDVSRCTGKGYKTAKLTHDGQRNFIVRPIDGNGNEMVTLANEIGAYSGTVVWNKQAATLSVRADGAWTIVVE